jgi:hypothetical protein
MPGALHTLLSVVGIAAGLVVAGGLVAGRRLDGWTGLFLVILTVVAYALYSKHLSGGWRTVYVTGSLMVLFFNVFVLIAQLFRRH